MNANIIVRQLMALGLTQREIERRSGVKQCVVSALNTGRYGRRTPYETVVALKKVLDDFDPDGRSPPGEVISES